MMGVLEVEGRVGVAVRWKGGGLNIVGSILFEK